MAADLPRKVTGSVTNYRVVIGRPDHTDNAGEVSNETGPQEIRINDKMHDDWQWQTFFHELVHVWELEGGFRMKDEPGDSDVDRLATAMCASWKRNKWVLPGQ